MAYAKPTESPAVDDQILQGKFYFLSKARKATLPSYHVILCDYDTYCVTLCTCNFCTLYNLYLSYFDTDVDLRAVLRATHTITDWYNLGLELDIPPPTLNKIQVDYLSVSERHRNMLQYWLNTGSATWLVLANAIMSPLVDKKGLANDIAKNYPCEFTHYFTFPCC